MVWCGVVWFGVVELSGAEIDAGKLSWVGLGWVSPVVGMLGNVLECKVLRGCIYIRG